MALIKLRKLLNSISSFLLSTRQQIPSQLEINPAANQPLNDIVLSLGKIHWILMSASLLVQAEIDREKPGRVINIPTRTYSPKKFGGDPISWWVFEQEHDIPTLRKETESTLELAQKLQKSATTFAKVDYQTLEELREEYIDFLKKHQNEIQGILMYVEWLQGKNRFAPSILYNYRTWGTTRMAMRNISADPAGLDNLDAIRKCSDLVLGLAIRNISVRDWIVQDLEHKIPEEKIQTKAVSFSLSQFTEYFKHLRDSLRNVLVEIERREEKERLVTSDDFWRQFIDIASSSTKTEQKYWDFKQTLDMWQKKDKREKSEKERKFAEIVAGFANNKGGVIVIGVSDASPRQIIGLGDDTHPLENNMKYTSQVLGKYIAYDGDYFHLQQVNVPDHASRKQLCLVIVIKQTRETLGVTELNDGNITYPFREETGIARKEKEAIQKIKHGIKNDNYDFLTVLQQFVNEEI